MRTTILAFLLVLPLPACAPAELTEADARVAMQARMERAAAREVKVQAIHSFALSDCADASDAAGRVCQVQMDVSFTVDGAPQRGDDTQPMRFVRESGKWVAYPAEEAPAAVAQ